MQLKLLDDLLCLVISSLSLPHVCGVFCATARDLSVKKDDLNSEVLPHSDGFTDNKVNGSSFFEEGCN